MTTPIFGREPVLILAAVEACIALAIGFGLDLTTEQFALLMTALAAVLGLAARSKVTPVPIDLSDLDADEVRA